MSAALKEKLEIRAMLVHQDHEVFQEHQELKENEANEVCVDQQGLLDLLENEDLQEAEVYPVQMEHQELKVFIHTHIQAHKYYALIFNSIITNHNI